MAAEILPFSLTMLSRDKLIVCNVKKVMLSSESALKFRIHGGVLLVMGDNLEIAEIGGGEVYVKGKIKGIEFE